MSRNGGYVDGSRRVGRNLDKCREEVSNGDDYEVYFEEISNTWIRFYRHFT